MPASTRRLSGPRGSRRLWRTLWLGPRRRRRSSRLGLGGRGRSRGRASRRRAGLIALRPTLRADTDDPHLAAIRRVEGRFGEQLAALVIDGALVARLQG